jgi:ribonuclease PH
MGECLPIDLRPTRDQREAGWTAPTLSETEATNHENKVIPNDLSAISVGLLGDDVFLDLDYVLDSNADVDMNVVGTSDGRFVEVQGTGEESTFSYDELQALLDMARNGLAQLAEMQAVVLSDIE